MTRATSVVFQSSPVSKLANPAAMEGREAFTPPSDVGNSSWHSPVPYLFGGLAAMLGLIAFALLILACSYWKLSGEVRDADGGGEVAKVDGAEEATSPPPFEEKFLVIMAGDVNPTFLATPSCSLKDNKVINVKYKENESRTTEANIPENNGEEFREIR